MIQQILQGLGVVSILFFTFLWGFNFGFKRGSEYALKKIHETLGIFELRNKKREEEKDGK